MNSNSKEAEAFSVHTNTSIDNRPASQMLFVISIMSLSARNQLGFTLQKQ